MYCRANFSKLDKNDHFPELSFFWKNKNSQKQYPQLFFIPF